MSRDGRMSRDKHHQDKHHLSRLAAGGLLSLLGSAVSAVAGIALVAVVTQGFTKSEAGILFTTTSVFVIVTAATQLGTEVGLVRWLPSLRATGRHAEIRQLLWLSLIPVLVLSTVVGALMYATADPVASRLIGSSQRDIGATMLRSLSFFVPVSALGSALLAATRGMGTMRPTVLIDGFGRSLGQPLVLLAVAQSGGAAALAIGWVAPYGVAAILSAWALGRQVRRAGRTVRQTGTASESPIPPQTPEPRRTLSADFWSFTRPRAVATLAQAALKRLDIVLVAALRSPAEAAVYTAATRFIVFGQLGVQAIQQSLSPQLGGLFASGDTRTAQSLFRTATAWTMSFAWPIYITCAFVGGIILAIFGDYSEGRSVIVILALAMLLSTASGAVDSVLLMAGRSWLSLGNTLAALAVNVVANLLLLPDLGIVGAAIAWALAIVTRNVLALLQVRYLLDIKAGLGPARWVALSASLSYGVPGLVLFFAGVEEWVSLTIFMLLSTPIYAALLWRRREALNLGLLASTIGARAGGRRRDTVASPV
jgi:O-antigen/teichoic acid export membrane protein